MLCPSFFLTVPDRKPRTLCACQLVAVISSLSATPVLRPRRSKHVCILVDDFGDREISTASFSSTCAFERVLEASDRAGLNTFLMAEGFLVRLFVMRWFPRLCAAGLQRLHHLKPRSSREAANFVTLCLRTASL